MQTLILAAEAAKNPPGDDLQTIAWIMTGIAVVIAGIAAAIVTPRAEHH